MKRYPQTQTMVSIVEEDRELLLADSNGSTAVGLLIERRPLLVRGSSAMSVMGTVRLTDGGLVFVPPATPDPRDPLNMKTWQKTVVVIVVCSFSAMTMSLIGGFGGIISFYIPGYMAQGETYPDITHLMTYPTLFMGLGNLIGMPIAIAVGRRAVILIATIILIIGATLCAASKSLEVHFIGRMMIGLASGQAESIVPLIVQEIHFLHERARVLMIQQSVQVVFSAVWQLFASPIAEAISPAWWYYMGAIIASVQFIAAIFLLPETKYPRTYPTLEQTDDGTIKACTTRPPLDFQNYDSRTWRSDMRLWVGSPEWCKAKEVLEQVLQLFLFPNMLWIILLCGLTLGINVSIATTYSVILGREPYDWPAKYLSYANCGQIPVALIGLPLMGYAVDQLTQWKARRNGGIHEPENRLLLLPFPIILGIFCTIMYGIGATHPWHFHWSLYLFILGLYFMAFTGTVIILTTYVLDSYPNRAGPALIVMCACRSMLSFLVSFNVANFIDRAGWDGTFAGFGLATAVVGLIGIPVFLYGKRLRRFTSRWIRDTKT